MNIALEYIVCQHEDSASSHAIKSHVNKNQNPGLEVSVGTGVVAWELLGLSPGTVEEGHPDDPAATRLDFYIAKTAFLNQKHLLPGTRARPRAGGRSVTNPTGTQRQGGKQISWRGSLAKLDIQKARMVFPTAYLRLSCENDVLLNIDWEPPKYPLKDGTKLQLHFGIEADWGAKRDRRLRTSRATIEMSPKQYADILAVLNQVR